MRTRLTMALLIGLLTLAGCGGDPSATPSPDASTTASSTPSPTAEPAPEMPAAATKPGAKGAEAFVRYYVELINHAQATGEVTSLERVSDERCKSCNSGASFVRSVYDDGGYIQGGEWRVTAVSAVLPRPDINGWIIDLDVSFGPQTVKTGEKIQRLKGGRSPFSFAVGQRDGSWFMSNWSRGR